MVTKTREEELKNQDKMTKNLFFEYERLQKRMERLSDPIYPAELKRKNAELENRLKTLGKEQKNLQIDQIRREKRLDKIISIGEPECLRDVQMQAKTLNTLTDRYSRI